MKKFIILISLNVLIAAAVIFWIGYNTKKSAYVDLNKVFNEFELSKEYNNKLTNYQNKAKTILDSMEIEINALAKRVEIEKGSKDAMLFDQKREEYFSKKDNFEQAYQEQMQQYTAQSMKQLNQYISDYGKENGYTYIYGADGNGTLMFADEKEEITQEVIAYINKKYIGKTSK